MSFQFLEKQVDEIYIFVNFYPIKKSLKLFRENKENNKKKNPKFAKISNRIWIEIYSELSCSSAYLCFQLSSFYCEKVQRWTKIEYFIIRTFSLTMTVRKSLVWKIKSFSFNLIITFNWMLNYHQFYCKLGAFFSFKKYFSLCWGKKLFLVVKVEGKYTQKKCRRRRKNN